MEAAVQNLKLVKLSNSEVIAMWDINPALFELRNFVVTYFVKHKEKEIISVTIDTTTYQINNLIPGQTYTVRVTAQYTGTTDSKILPVTSIEESVTLDPIGMHMYDTFNKFLYGIFTFVCIHVRMCIYLCTLTLLFILDIIIMTGDLQSFCK